MNCYFEMPYFKGFRVEIENTGTLPVNVYYQIDCEEKKILLNSLYFHAQFRRINPMPYKEVYTILDNVKGDGLYVGTYLHWGVKSNGWWGEGEIKFFIDGDTKMGYIDGTYRSQRYFDMYRWHISDPVYLKKIKRLHFITFYSFILTDFFSHSHEGR